MTAVPVPEGYTSYLRYLGSSEWQQRRTRILRRSGGLCEICGRKPRETLTVHHVTYDRVGHEGDADLLALCSACHGEQHRQAQDPDEPLDWLDWSRWPGPRPEGI